MLSAGTKFGHYTVRSALGSGGMGEVYLAEDSELERLVALKVLPTEFVNDRERIRRFIQEAKAASALNHPNILIVHQIGQVDGINFIATEFVEGVTLRQKIKHVRLPLDETLDITAQVASALDAAHQSGIVHRDIKPENIMLRHDGLVKVLDFGLAKITALQLTKVEIEATTIPFVQTNPRTVLGTVAYMSPEQARGLKIDGRSDIWSLGIVLYELLIGQLPFAGETVSDCIASILKTELPPIGETENAPAELQRIVRKSLAKKRDERYQTARDLLIDLKTLRHDLELQAALERSASPHFQKTKTNPNENELTVITNRDSNEQAAITAPQTAPSAEYATRQIKQHRLGVGLILVTLILGIAALVYFSYFSRKDAVSSIAVLPFVNVSNDSNTEFLSDGISESLINDLSQLPGVKVINRSSSFKFKGKETDLQEVANALGVQAIVMGRVTQSGDNFLINVELVNVRDKTQIWGEQYTRKAADLLQVQSAISKEVAEKLHIRLTGAQERRITKGETINPQAYELLLKSKIYNRKGGKENMKKSLEYINQAIALDPNYALAYVRLSIAYRNLVDQSILDPKEGKPKAESAAYKAVELDENLAEAHFALATIKRDAWQWQEAEREFKRAVELNPNLSSAHSGYASYLRLIKRHDEAVAEIKYARELDPLSPIVNADVSWTLYLARRYDEAIEAILKELEIERDNPDAHYILGYIYMAKGMFAEAIAEYQETIKLGLDIPGPQIYQGVAYARKGETERARKILKQLQESKEYVSPAELAILYAALDEHKQAFAALEKAYVTHDLQLQTLAVDAAYDPLRSDARFLGLLQRIGLPH